MASDAERHVYSDGDFVNIAKVSELEVLVC